MLVGFTKAYPVYQVTGNISLAIPTFLIWAAATFVGGHLIDFLLNLLKLKSRRYSSTRLFSHNLLALGMISLSYGLAYAMTGFHQGPAFALLSMCLFYIFHWT